MLRDVAYQAITPVFWNSMDMIGGKSSYWMGGAFNDGKGEPSQSNSVSHGCVPARFRNVRILNTARTRVRAQRLRDQSAAGRVTGRELAVPRAGAGARRPGAEAEHRRQTRVTIVSGWSGNTRFADANITTSGGVDDTSVTVTATIGKRRAPRPRPTSSTMRR